MTTRRPVTRVLVAMLCLALATLGAPAHAETPAAAAAARLIHEAALPVTMRDGTILRAHVFRAAGATAQPVILAFTPYAIQELLPRARYFAAHGYVFVAVSSRGRGDSDGEFAPFTEWDGRDAADAIAWAAALPGSNGAVGMWGGSYLGYAQWAAAGERPAALRTIVPAAAVFPGVDYPMWRNVKMSYLFQWLAALQGRSDWFDTAFDDDAWADAVRAQRTAGRPFADLAPRSGQRADVARSWLDAPEWGSRWRAATASDAALAQLDLPVLSITGQFDGDQRGALAHHARLLAANPRAASRSVLLIGPWNHSGTRTPGEIMAGERVDAESVLDMNALHKAWYDWTLKDGPRPALLGDALVYFTLGTGRWQHARGLSSLDSGQWFQPTSRRGDPTATTRPGLLDRAAAPPARLSYVLDTRTSGLRNPIGFEAVPSDTRDVDVLDGDGLVFDTASFDSALELTGLPRFTAWISSTRVDGDVYASLLVVAPDGRAKRIGFDMQRLRHRNGTDRSDPMPRGVPQRVEFDGFGFVSRRVEPGARLRLVLHSNAPAYLEHNYAGGGTVAHELAADGGPQRITLHQGHGHRSAVFLPLRPLRSSESER